MSAVTDTEHDTALSQGLLAALRRLDDDDELAAGVLTGAGGSFSAGMDLKAFATSGTPTGLDEVFRSGSRKPLIAAVEGFALAAGLEVALVCDLVVAAENARFGIPEASVGLFAGGGGVLRLPARVGYGLAMEMALTADPISATQAHTAGLVSRLAAPGTAVDVAVELAQRIARNAPRSLEASLAVIKGSLGLTDAEGWTFQAPIVATVFTSDDAEEGARAFLEKRTPVWTGR